MFNSETLEVAIGMAFLFMLMALLCTAAKEWLEGVLKWRAMDLERAVRTLLDDADGSLTAHVYRHPLIYSLFQGTYRPQDLTSSALTPGRGAQHMRLSERRNLPSYIPSGHFANALLDLVARGPVDADTAADAAAPLTVASLRQRAALLASPHLRRALLTAIDHSGDDLERLRANLQAWFDGTMDRATGWYKRRTQAVLFMFGLGAAVLMNVDALHVMQRLTVDKALRDVVVKQAEAAQAPQGSASSAKERFDETRVSIDKIGLPIGWRDIGEKTDAKAGLPIPRQLCTNPNDDPCEPVKGLKQAWLSAAVGWLITALAVMLGAPFWFDVLSKLMTVRSTKKPAETEADKTRDTTPAAAPVTAEKAAASTTADKPPTFEPHEWRDGFDNPRQVTL